jgi:hypothetical protein
MNRPSQWTKRMRSVGTLIILFGWTIAVALAFLLAQIVVGHVPRPNEIGFESLALTVGGLAIVRDRHATPVRRG